MAISATSNLPFPLAGEPGMEAADPTLSATAGDSGEVREHFDTFFGEMFYGQMLKALRSTTSEPAYFHGGRAEEIFQGQLDQMLAQEMTKSGVMDMTEQMFGVFSNHRRS